MKNINEVVFIIQARTQSTRVPNKMLREFAGSSLFEVAINKFLSSSIIPKENICLSILDDELIDIANKYELSVFNRSKESTYEPISLQKIFEWYDKLDYKYYVILNGCSPLLKVKTLDNFIEDFLTSSSNGLFSVFEKKHFMYDLNHRMVNNFLGEKKYLTTFETKLLETIYEAAGCLYAGTMSDIGKDIYMGTFKFKNDPKFYIMNEYESLDVDYPWQFEMAEILYKKHLMEGAAG